MKEFMMIFRNEKMENGGMPSDEQMQDMTKKWQTWISGIAKKGRFSGTNRLLTDGKTLKPGKLVTDGPYMEVKEMVGGYLIVKASSLDEAVEMAQSCPNLIYGGNVEIRTVMSIEHDTNSEHFLQEKILA